MQPCSLKFNCLLEHNHGSLAETCQTQLTAVCLFTAQCTDSCPAHASDTKVEPPPSCQCPAHSHHVILSRRSCHSGE